MRHLKGPFILGDKRRRFIPQLFEEWDKIICDYENKLDNDLPYAYGERTNVGILALAAKRIGGYPLEEYSTVKGSKKDKGAGRADLWIRDKNENGWDFEAKHLWRSFFRPRNLTSVTAEYLDEAVYDVKQLTYPSRYQVGLVFLTLYTRSNKEVEHTLNRFDGGVSEFKDKLRDLHSKLESGGYEGEHYIAAHFATLDLLNSTKSNDDNSWHDYYGGIVAICRFWEPEK